MSIAEGAQKTPLEELVVKVTEVTDDFFRQQASRASDIDPIEYTILKIFAEYKEQLPKKINKQREKAEKVYEGRNILPVRKNVTTLVDEMINSYISMEKQNIGKLEDATRLGKLASKQCDVLISDYNVKALRDKQDRLKEIEEELGYQERTASKTAPVPPDWLDANTPDPEDHAPFKSIGEVDPFPYEALVLSQQGSYEGESLDPQRRADLEVEREEILIDMRDLYTDSQLERKKKGLLDMANARSDKVINQRIDWLRNLEEVWGCLQYNRAPEKNLLPTSPWGMMGRIYGAVKEYISSSSVFQRAQ